MRLHYSASFPGECRIADEVRLLATTRGMAWAIGRWIDSVPVRFRELSGDRREVVYLGRSAGGVPHWIIEED